MPKTRIPLDEADIEQLRAFATSKGVEFPKTVNSTRLIGIIRHSGWPQDYIEIDDDPAPVSRPATQGKVMASTLPPSLFTRRDLGQADAPMVYGAKLLPDEVKRLRAEGAIFLDGLTVAEIKDVEARQAELKRLRDLRDNAYVRVLIHETKEEGALPRVPLSVNGVAMVVQRGQQSDLRWPYYLALQALDPLFEKDANDRIIGERVTPSYPHSVLDGPQLEDVAA